MTHCPSTPALAPVVLPVQVDSSVNPGSSRGHCVGFLPSTKGTGGASTVNGLVPRQVCGSAGCVLPVTDSWSDPTHSTQAASEVFGPKPSVVGSFRKKTYKIVTISLLRSIYHVFIFNTFLNS